MQRTTLKSVWNELLNNCLQLNAKAKPPFYSSLWKTSNIFIVSGLPGDNVVHNSVGWCLMLVVVNNQVPLDIFWGQNTIYVSAAGGDLCLPSHSHWSRELTPSFCWPTQAGAAAWSPFGPLGMEMLGLISISRTRDITGGDRVTLVMSHITSQYTLIQSTAIVLKRQKLLLPWQ